MGAIIKVKIDLNKIDKSKIFEGKKGKYYELDVFVNDKVDNFGQNVSVSNPTATKEETKTYLGNGKVIWTNGTIEVAPKQDQPSVPSQPQSNDDSGLPF